MTIHVTNPAGQGPAGIQGPAGAQGPAGPVGANGTSNIHAAVNAATVQPLSGVWTYTVGTTGQDGGNGIGATLTSSTAGIPAIDAVNLPTGSRVLVKDQADLKQNGIYYVTRGAAGQTPIWTRATDYDNSIVGQVNIGDSILILTGTLNSNKTYYMSASGTMPDKSIKIGTDNIVFNQASNLINVNTDILPSLDNTYNLGSTSFRWKSVNIGPGTLTITDTVTNNPAVITVTSGVLKIDGANQLQVGQLKFVDNTIESSTGGTDIQIGLTGSTANLVLNRNTVLATGKSLTFGDSTVQTTAAVAQVNSDWNATTGKAQILNKPTIPASQVNSDWNATTGVSQILNKPTLSTVATSGSYNDLSNQPNIPAAQVSADWNSVSGVSQILNKPTIPVIGSPTSFASTWAGTGLTFTGTYATSTYVQVGKIVQFQIAVVCTNVSNFGSGNYTLTLPVAASGPASLTGVLTIGAKLYDLVGTTTSGSTTINLYSKIADGGNTILQALNHNSAGNFATSSTFNLSGSYIAQ